MNELHLQPQTGRIQLLHHYYWHEKPSFQLDEDTYPHWGIFAVEQGGFRFGIGDDEDGEATFGDWVVCPPNTPFRREVIQPKPLTFHFLRFEWATAPSMLPMGKITFRDRERLSSAYRYMQQLSALPEEQALLWRNRFVQELWDGYVLQHMLPEPAPSDPVCDDSLMLAARRKLQERAFHALSMNELAAECSLSPVQFTRRFKTAFGCTASDYVRELRLAESKRLLTETSLTIEQVAHRSGYDNGFYFSRVFSRHIQMSPSEYRRAHRV
ncbi:helix-turn-helix domain-containing protein [Paenibacillus sp. YYML68]|uniref:helix-turn-helix domain-containing protein n=1 Tax=Paenibacillus sp. YYML68 TaxID=2909250 RepID=UPI00248FD888|nr:AraC family transcriptional regulator [Paenibacillus sp. YYML68]